MKIKCNKNYFILLLLICSTILCSCSGKNIFKDKDGQKNQDKTTENAVTSEDSDFVFKDKELIFKNREEYYKYISNVKGFKPYYRAIFLFENLKNENLPDWHDRVFAMYKELKSTYDYYVFRPLAMRYVGEFKLPDKFLEGTDDESGKDIVGNEQNINSIKVIKNKTIHSADFGTYNISLLKCYDVDEYIAHLFDKDIEIGKILVKKILHIKNLTIQ